MYSVKGYSIEVVETEWDYGVEGFMLAHCLGTKDWMKFHKNHVVFSIRDKYGVPHATLLYARSRTESDYGDFNDFLGGTPMMYYGEALHHLQARGRNDNLAMRPFHRIAREFHKSRGGTLGRHNAILDAYCTLHGDRDRRYHYEYTLGPYNPFTFSYRWFSEPEDRSTGGAKPSPASVIARSRLAHDSTGHSESGSPRIPVVW